MFAGKTTTLFQKMIIFKEMGMRVLYINHSLDMRTEHQNWSSHNPTISHANFDTVQCSDTNTIPALASNYDVIGIDEAQFFHGLKDMCLFLVEQQNKIVFVAGLDTDFNRNIFGEIHLIASVSDTVTKLHSFCRKCIVHNKVTEALFTKMKCSTTYSTTTTTNNNNLITIGGSETYEPVCRWCYLDNS